jgi:hypothetical protein
MRERGYANIRPKDSKAYYDERYVHYRKEMIYLAETFALENIRPCHVAEWKEVEDHKYFSATTEDGKEVVARSGGNRDTQQEYRTAKRLSEQNGKHFVTPTYFKCDGNKRYLVTERKADAIPLEDWTGNCKQKEKLIAGLLEILKIIQHCGLINGRLDAGSFHILADSTPVLMDYRFIEATPVGIKRFRSWKNLRRMSKNKMTLPKVLDDASAMLQLAKQIEQGDYPEIQSMVGKLTVSLGTRHWLLKNLS